MKSSFFKIICITSALALVVAFGSPQVGKRKGGGGNSSGGGSGGGGNTGGGGGGNSGGGGGRQNEPPPVRTTNGGGGGGTENGGGRSTGGDVNRGGGGDQRGGGSVGGWPDRQDRGGTTVISGGPPGRRGHSGNVSYGTTNNVIQVGNVRISRPTQVINPGMQRRINDQERVTLVRDGWRVGYHHYDNRWCDDNFNYPWYVFNPWQSNRFVCSPWYYYASCPPYLNGSRIIIINSGWPSYNWSGNAYRYDRPDFSDRWSNRSDLDYAIRDLQDAFERRDYRAMDRLIPRDGNVHMYFDGRYGYSLDVRDFYDLFEDGVENVRTVRYDIMDVQYGNRGARVVAKHEFVDPWGQRNFTYHSYFLVQEGRDWVIREFGSSNFRP
jgi:hypothetical protein